MMPSSCRSTALMAEVALLVLALLPQKSAQPAQQQGVAAQRAADQAALLALQAAVVNWDAYAAAAGLDGWDSSHSFCQWTGVSCTDQGLVQSISLQCGDGCTVRAAGTLPAALAAGLSACTTIDLQNQAFAGPLPPDWGDRPGALPALQNLYLSGNSLNGSVPAAWGAPGAFPQLSLLRLDSNALSGSLPAELGSPAPAGPGPGGGSLSSLAILRANNNLLRGSLPEAWGRPGAWPRLQVLVLSNNSLTGGVPASWQEPTAIPGLQELDLQDNALSGQLPGSWGGNGSWRLMRYLYLSTNALGGTLPPEWGQAAAFPSLKVLTLNDTELAGTLPPEWGTSGAFPQVDTFWLERNQLRGGVPPSWAGLASLQRLVLRPGNPALCGPVPAGFPFSICTDEDLSCLREQPNLLEPQCGGAASAAGGGGGGGGVPVAAIAAPVAAAAAVVLVAALWVGVRRRRRRQREADSAGKAEASAQRALPPPHAHPFDDAATREALTSPFAAGAFQAAADAPDALQRPSPFQPQQRAGSREAAAAARRLQYSAGTRTGSDTLSGASSYRSYLAAKCARIETKSLPLGGLPSAVATAAAAANAASFVTAPARLSDDRRSVEVQSSSSAATRAAREEEAEEGRDVLGAMSDRRPARTSSEMSPPYSASGSSPRGSGLELELPFSDWEISPAEITIMKRPDGSDWCLGSGGFGRVYKALCNGVQPVAVKVLNTPPDLQQARMDDFRREVAILKSCRDVNIVQFVGACLSPDQTMLVTEYMEGGNLAVNIAARRVSWWKRGRKIALDVARGLVFLHSRRIIHFDIKSPNILLARDGSAKLSDVGMSRIMARSYVTGAAGTLAWAAPEMLWGEKCTERADIYSYGIVLWELCSGEVPVRGQLRDLRVPEECPAAVRDMCLQCLETRPSRRPSALQIVQQLLALPPDPPRASPAAAGSSVQEAAPAPPRPAARSGSGGHAAADQPANAGLRRSL